MRYSIPELPEDNFDWITWRQGVYVWRTFGFHPRYATILANAELLRKHAIGYIPGHKLWYRYKPEHMAVMFLVNDEFGWSHLRIAEFDAVFGVC